MAPAQTQDQQTKIDKPMTGAGDVLPTAPDQNAKPADTGKTPEVPSQGDQNTALMKQAVQSTLIRMLRPKRHRNRRKKQRRPRRLMFRRKLERHSRTPAPKPKASMPSPSAAAAAPASPDADLELAGERYCTETACHRIAPGQSRTCVRPQRTGIPKPKQFWARCTRRPLRRPRSPYRLSWFARALHRNRRIRAYPPTCKSCGDR